MRLALSVCLLLTLLSTAVLAEETQQAPLYVGLVWEASVGQYFEKQEVDPADQRLSKLGLPVIWQAERLADGDTIYEPNLSINGSSRFADRKKAESLRQKLYEVGFDKARLFVWLQHYRSPATLLSQPKINLPCVEQLPTRSQDIRHGVYVSAGEDPSIMDCTLQQLCDVGIEAYAVEHSMMEAGPICCGMFKDRAEAEKRLAELRALGYTHSLISLEIPIPPDFRYNQANSAEIRRMARVMEAERDYADPKLPVADFHFRLILQEDLNSRFPCELVSVYCAGFPDETAAAVAADRLRELGHNASLVNESPKADWEIFVEGFDNFEEANALVSELRAQGFDASCIGVGSRSPGSSVAWLSPE